MARSDISDKLIHFTKGDDYDESLKSLFNILRCGRLIGGTGKIKGGFPCVCFTEAPLPAISHAFVADGRLARYSPFGVIVSKKWLFERGGRPVIYQSDAEFQALPAEMRWRHVRYEPNGCPPTDFSWER